MPRSVYRRRPRRGPSWLSTLLHEFPANGVIFLSYENRRFRADAAVQWRSMSVSRVHPTRASSSISLCNGLQLGITSEVVPIAAVLSAMCNVSISSPLVIGTRFTYGSMKDNLECGRHQIDLIRSGQIQRLISFGDSSNILRDTPLTSILATWF